MRTSNPVFRTLEKRDTYAVDQSASYQGIIIKTSLLLAIAVISGYLAMTLLPVEMLLPLVFTAAITAFIAVLISQFVPRLAMPFGIIYAASEGVLLGTITTIFEASYPGIAMTAIIATLAIFAVMLFLYSSRVIRVTSMFRRIMTSILLGFLVFFIIFGILSLFTNFVPMSNGLAIGISAIMIVFGALMLTLDFDNAARIVDSQADKVYEWVVSIGLMVTLVWIYIELLRLFFLLASRNR